MITQALRTRLHNRFPIRRRILVCITLALLLAGVVLFALYLPPWTVIVQGIAVALYVLSNVLLYRDIRRDRQQREVVLRISEELASRTELGDLLDYIAHSVRQLVPLSTKCVIHLLDEHGRRLYPRYSSQPDWERTLGIPVGKGIAGAALQDRRVKVVDDVRQDPAFLPLESSAELRSLMVAPLYVQDTLLGTISLNSPVPGAFGERDEELLTLLAAQASTAIHQAQLYEAAQRETHYVETIIQHLDDGLVVLDAQSRIVRYNPAVAHLLGADVDSLTGEHLRSDSDHPGVRQLAQILNAAPEGHECRWERTVELMEPLHAVLHVTVTPVRDPDGHSGQIVVIHDRTREQSNIRAAENLVDGMAREVERTASASRSYASLIASYDLAEHPRVARWATQIQRGTTRLLRLADGLDDLCTAEGDSLTMPREAVSMDEVLAWVKQHVALQGAQKEIEFEIACDQEVPTISVDRERIKHVLLNLIENALDRSVRGGQIHVKAEATPMELMVTVSDNGRCISAADQARIFYGIFDPNGTSEKEGAAAHGPGTGLDLYISRRLIEAMGGHLWLVDGAARGATFQFIVPLIQDDRIPS